MLDSIADALKTHEDGKAARAKAKAMQELKMKASLKHLTPERVFARKKVKGEPCHANEFKTMSDDETSPRKDKGKNIMRGFPFIMPIPDKYKELSEKLILKAKFDTDKEGNPIKKLYHAYVERMGQVICVPAGHPDFLHARA